LRPHRSAVVGRIFFTAGKLAPGHLGLLQQYRHSRDPSDPPPEGLLTAVLRKRVGVVSDSRPRRRHAPGQGRKTLRCSGGGIADVVHMRRALAGCSGRCGARTMAGPVRRSSAPTLSSPARRVQISVPRVLRKARSIALKCTPPARLGTRAADVVRIGRARPAEGSRAQAQLALEIIVFGPLAQTDSVAW
jgi:hypothetical protein